MKLDLDFERKSRPRYIVYIFNSVARDIEILELVEFVMASKQCRACHKNIGRRIKLQCGRCSGYFHLDCGNVSEVDARLMQAEKTTWTCNDCDTQRSRRSSMFIPSPKTNGDDMTELKNMIRELQTEVREVKRSMDFINEKYEEEKKRNKIMSDMFAEISQDNQILKERVHKLESVLNNQNLSKIKQNLCISGFPLNGDNKKASPDDLVKLCTALNVPVTINDFEAIRQFNTQNGIKVTVTLKNLELKNQILIARSKKGKINPVKCGLGTSEAPIFIDEELTKETYNLFKKAKALKELGYKYVWHRNGKVLMRKNDGDNAVHIKNDAALNELLA